MGSTLGQRTAAVLAVLLTAMLARLRTAAGGHDRERGDVPGWVMITLMSAVLVAGILAIAKPALEGLFNDAMNQVSQR
jgi:hypothetical protein